MRLFRSLICATLALSTALLPSAVPVSAADVSDHDIVGFSRDGRWFAFREFGTHDGSGFPFARLFVLDTIKDTWAKNTPVRVTLEDEQRTLIDALAELDRKGRASLDTLGIRFPAQTFAAMPIRQQGEPVTEVDVRMYYPASPASKLRLETIAVPGGGDCFDLGQPVGLKVTVETETGIRTVYEDAKLPASRSCPLGYSFAQLVGPPGEPDGRFVLLVYMFSPGFEGRNVTVMPVPIQFGN